MSSGSDMAKRLHAGLVRSWTRGRSAQVLLGVSSLMCGAAIFAATRNDVSTPATIGLLAAVAVLWLVAHMAHRYIFIRPARAYAIQALLSLEGPAVVAAVARRYTKWREQPGSGLATLSLIDIWCRQASDTISADTMKAPPPGAQAQDRAFAHAIRDS